MSPDLALQGAITALLKSDTDAAAALRNSDGTFRIHDRVPGKDSPFAFVSFGPSQVTQQDADCMYGYEAFQQVDIWSREPGFTEAKRLSDLVRAAVHDKTATQDGLTFDIEHRFTTTQRDGDGLTSHGILSFRAEIYVNA